MIPTTLQTLRSRKHLPKKKKGNAKSDKGDSANSEADVTGISAGDKEETEFASAADELDRSKADDFKSNMFLQAGYVYDPSKRTYLAAPACTSYPKIQIPAILGEDHGGFNTFYHMMDGLNMLTRKQYLEAKEHCLSVPVSDQMASTRTLSFQGEFPVSFPECQQSQAIDDLSEISNSKYFTEHLATMVPFLSLGSRYHSKKHHHLILQDMSLKFSQYSEIMSMFCSIEKNLMDFLSWNIKYINDYIGNYSEEINPDEDIEVNFGGWLVTDRASVFQQMGPPFEMIFSGMMYKAGLNTKGKVVFDVDKDVFEQVYKKITSEEKPPAKKSKKEKAARLGNIGPILSIPQHGSTDPYDILRTPNALKYSGDSPGMFPYCTLLTNANARLIIQELQKTRNCIPSCTLLGEIIADKKTKQLPADFPTKVFREIRDAHTVDQVMVIFHADNGLCLGFICERKSVINFPYGKPHECSIDEDGGYVFLVHPDSSSVEFLDHQYAVWRIKYNPDSSIQVGRDFTITRKTLKYRNDLKPVDHHFAPPSSFNLKDDFANVKWKGCGIFEILFWNKLSRFPKPNPFRYSNLDPKHILAMNGMKQLYDSISDMEDGPIKESFFARYHNLFDLRKNASDQVLSILSNFQLIYPFTLQLSTFNTTNMLSFSNASLEVSASYLFRDGLMGLFVRPPKKFLSYDHLIYLIDNEKIVISDYCENWLRKHRINPVLLSEMSVEDLKEINPSDEFLKKMPIMQNEINSFLAKHFQNNPNNQLLALKIESKEIPSFQACINHNKLRFYEYMGIGRSPLSPQCPEDVKKSFHARFLREKYFL